MRSCQNSGKVEPVFALLKQSYKKSANENARAHKPMLDFAQRVRILRFLVMDFPKAEIEALWCPWRVEYFEQEAPNPNFLSEAARTSDDAAHFVITRRKNAFLIMNRYPYAVGHLMAVPYRKTADLASLGENEVLELWSLAVHGQALLRETMKAQGFNIGLNLGQCAGAGVPDYMHLHIVPRWVGDTNFMPVLSGTRMLSEALTSLYEKLVAAQTRMAATGA